MEQVGKRAGELGGNLDCFHSGIMDQEVHQSMKVVFIHQDGKLTGSAISMLTMIQGFENQADVHVVLPQKGPLCDLLADHKIAYSVIPFTPFWTAPGPQWYQRQSFTQLKVLFPNRRLKKEILNLNPDVIHLNDKACLHAGISLRNAGVPIVQHLRSTYYTTYSILNKLISKLAIKKYASSFVAISEDEIQGFERDSRVQVIFNSVNLSKTDKLIKEKEATRHSLGLCNNDFVIGFTANISKMKGAWDFLDMAIKIVERFPEQSFRFLIAGNVPKRIAKKPLLKRMGLRDYEMPAEKLEAYLSMPQLKEKVALLGFQKDILKVISAFDIMVIPTHLGALGRQTFEAMSVKIPVVVTAGHSGKSSIVVNEKSGMVVPISNVEALTDAVAKLVIDPNRRKQLGENGYQHVQKEFDPNINSRRILKIYKNLTYKPAANQTVHAARP